MAVSRDTDIALSFFSHESDDCGNGSSFVCVVCQVCEAVRGEHCGFTTTNDTHHVFSPHMHDKGTQVYRFLRHGLYKYIEKKKYIQLKLQVKQNPGASLQKK